MYKKIFSNLCNYAPNDKKQQIIHQCLQSKRATHQQTHFCPGLFINMWCGIRNKTKLREQITVRMTLQLTVTQHEVELVEITEKKEMSDWLWMNQSWLLLLTGTLNCIYFLVNLRSILNNCVIHRATLVSARSRGGCQSWSWGRRSSFSSLWLGLARLNERPQVREHHPL